MNIANSLRLHFVFCTAGFAPFPDLAGYVDYKDENAFDAANDADADWFSDSAPIKTTAGALTAPPLASNIVRFLLSCLL